MVKQRQEVLRESYDVCTCSRPGSGSIGRRSDRIRADACRHSRRPPADHNPRRRSRKAVDGVERLLYVTDKSGVSVYDINDSHRLLRKIDVPGTGDYKGISASVQLGKLYLTSYKKDELVCVDLATDKILWRRHYSDGYADSQAMTPDGKTLYLRCATATVGGSSTRPPGIRRRRSR